MSTVCYCGQPDCPVTTWEHDACDANLRAERDALKAQLAKAHERLDEFGMRRDGQTATLEEGIDAMRDQLLDYRRWAYEAEGRASKLKARVADLEEGNIRRQAALEAERDALKIRLEELEGPVCTDAECLDHDGEHPHHFNAVALFWRRVEDTYENRNALCESAPVPPVQAWREERDALKAQLAEAVEVLRRIAGPQGMGFGGMDGASLAECARAFLAKVKP